MKPRSLIARTLVEAKALLSEAGLEIVSVVETGPPRTRPAGPLRVVRERRTESGVELVAAASIELKNGDGRHI